MKNLGFATKWEKTSRNDWITQVRKRSLNDRSSFLTWERTRDL